MESFGEMTPDVLGSEHVGSPAFVVNEVAVERNLRVLERVQVASGAKILLALKGFAMWSLFPTIRRYLPGAAASSLSEARLAKELGGEVHVYAPAYDPREMPVLLDLADHMVFNSTTEWERWRDQAIRHPDGPTCGLRLNPEHSEVRTSLYDPCAPGSRLGTTLAELEAYQGSLEGLHGLHFHTLCELGCDALQRTLAVVEKKFSAWLPKMRWINFGGGHHITRRDYDVDGLIALIKDFQGRHPHLQVYLEPGEAIGLNTGVLVATVLDVRDGKTPLVILDTSATAHMPDVLEMPYRPEIFGAAEPGKKPYTYRLGGMTCLAGDVVGDYSFDAPLEPGDRLVFGDMAHYSMVKTTTFNGVRLPDIAIHNSDTGLTRTVRIFGYEDYKRRLS